MFIQNRSQRPSWMPIGKCLLTVSLAVGGVLGIEQPVKAVPPGYTVNWSDEFHQGINAKPNPAVWQYDLGAGGWGNGEWETYVDSLANCHIIADKNATDGQALQIEVQQDSAGNYYSARINTGGKLFPQYGFVEARIKLPWSKGMWPAFWMLGENIGSVGWPACGEMDIMENIGSSPYTNWGSLHAPNWDPSATYNDPNNEWFRDRYHLFQLNWTPSCVTFCIDDIPYETRTINEYSPWPFNSPMFFILNLAVGGAFPGSPDSTTVTPMDLDIDYVRVYHLTGIPANQVVSLFAQANSKFITADNAGSSPLVANRTAASTWEQFQIIDIGSGNVALLSLANNRFVTADNAGASPLIAKATSIGTWEEFHWEPHPDGTVSLKSLANNRYVSADLNLADPPQLIANRTTASGWESFGVTCYYAAPAVVAPPRPTGPTAVAGIGQIKLSWNASGGATSYNLYRSTVSGREGLKPFVSGITGPTYTDKGLKTSIKYYYRIGAVNSAGISPMSSEVNSYATISRP